MATMVRLRLEKDHGYSKNNKSEEYDVNKLTLTSWLTLRFNNYSV